jgi:hypothetical protein
VQQPLSQKLMIHNFQAGLIVQARSTLRHAAPQTIHSTATPRSALCRWSLVVKVNTPTRTMREFAPLSGMNLYT